MTETENNETAKTDGPESIDTAHTTTTAPRMRGTKTLVCFVAAGIVGAALSCVAIGNFDEFFQLPEELTSQLGISSELQARFDSGELTGGQVMGMGMAAQDPDLQQNIDQAKRANYVQNTALCFALIGLLLAGCLGCAAGYVRKSTRLSVLGLVAGLVLGAGLGTVGGLAVIGTEDLLEGSVDQMLRTMAMHAAGWALIGIAVGVSVGLPTQPSRSVHFVVAAVIAGVLSAVLFTLGAAVIFSGDNADLPVPDGNGNRLLWTGLCAFGMALMVGRVARTTNQLNE